LSPNVGLNHALAALHANTGRNRLNNHEFALHPEVLIDLPLLHLLAADLAFTVVVFLLLTIVHGLFQRVRGYKKQLSGFFDSTDYRCFALVTGCSNYLVSSAPRIACKPSADSAGADYVFDICED
jgi:hypothetical protein